MGSIGVDVMNTTQSVANLIALKPLMVYFKLSSLLKITQFMTYNKGCKVGY